MSVNSGYTKTGVNGLGIRPADGKMFGFARVGADTTPVTGGAWWVRLIETNASGVWQASSVTSSWYRLTNGDQPIAGAVDPATGHYFFGGWGDARRSTGAQSSRMTIYEYDGTSITALGMITVTGTGIVSTGTAAGDIAFDPSGNLYALRGNSDEGAFTVTTVTRASLDAARANPNITSSIPSQSSKQVTVSDHAVGGIAVLQDGSLAVANQYKVWTIDPVTMAVINSSLRNGNFGGDPSLGVNDDRIQDLASCAASTTVTVQKDLPNGRAHGGDQFTLAVTDGQGTVFLENTTTGNSDDVQPDKAGPVLVRVGATYGAAETAAGSTVLSDYTSTLTCSVDGGDPVTVTPGGNGTSGTLTIPSSAAGKNITCTFTNTPKTPELELVKVDASDPDLALAGAKFQLWLDVNANGTLETAVDTKVGGEQTTPGSDVLNWTTGLAAGKYLLEETAAPAGYQIGDPAVHAVTLAASKVTVTVENVRLTGTVEWSKTDGVGSDPDDGDEPQPDALPSGHPLGGSEWMLVGPTGPGSANLHVTDCDSSDPDGCAGEVDKDPRAGYFRIDGLAWGDYTLTETKAPAGYVLDPTARPFSVGPTAPASLEIDLGEIVNTQRPPLAIPLTGGMGADTFLIGGALLLGSVALLAALRRRRAAALGMAVAKRQSLT